MRAALAALLALRAVAFADGPPPPLPRRPTTAPKVERAQLDNGLTLLLHARRDLPYAVIELVVDAGEAAQPAGLPGLAALTIDLLQGGSRAPGAPRDAAAVADAIADLGATIETGADADFAFASVGVLRDGLPAALTLLANLAVFPSLTGAELDRARERQRASLLAAQDDPAQVADALLATLAYGEGHPYARPRFGTLSSLARIRNGDVERFHRDRYRPGGAAVVIVGDLSLEEARALVEASALGRWRGGAPRLIAIPPARPSRGGVALVDRPGAAQAQVGFALLAPPAGGPDEAALEAIDAVLGATYGSRLNHDLREQHAFCYGTSSSIAWRRGPSLLVARGAMREDATLAAYAELRLELARLVAEPPTDEEIERAKAQLRHGAVAEFETLTGAAQAIAERFALGLAVGGESDHLARFLRAVDALDGRSVGAALDARLSAQLPSAPFGLVGDRARIEAALAPLRRIERREPTGARPNKHL